MPTSTFNPIGYVQDRKPLVNRTGDIGQILNYIEEQRRLEYQNNAQQINRRLWAAQNSGAVEPVAYADVIPEAVKAMTGSDMAALASGFISPQSLFKKTKADIFIGSGAKTWDTKAVERATQMEAEKIDPRVIWKETGTWRGPDGMWRQEIDDSSMRMRSAAERVQIADKYKERKKEIGTILKDTNAHKGLSPKDLAAAQRNLRAESRRIDNILQDLHSPDAPDYYGSRAKHAIDHSPLFTAYPQLGEAVVRQDYDGSMLGLFQPGTVSLNKWLLKRPVMRDSVAGHELMHGVQDEELFARGGTPAEVTAFNKHAARERETIEVIEASNMLRFLQNDRGLGHQASIEAYEKQTGVLPSLTAIALLKHTPSELATQLAEAKQQLKKYGIFSGFSDATAGYRHLSGEAEARAVQARMRMTPEQRRATFPEDSYDVPIEDLINIYTR